MNHKILFLLFLIPQLALANTWYSAGNFLNTTPSSSTATGSVIIGGGLGVDEDGYFGGKLIVESDGTTLVASSSGPLQLQATFGDATPIKIFKTALGDAYFWNYSIGDIISFGTEGAEKVRIESTGLLTANFSAALRDQGVLRLHETSASGSDYVGIRAPASVTTTQTYTLPNGDGTSGQFLQTDGSQTLTWATPVAGSGDVAGPASSVSGNIASFDGGTGKIIKDALVPISTSNLNRTILIGSTRIYVGANDESTYLGSEAGRDTNFGGGSSNSTTAIGHRALYSVLGGGYHAALGAYAGYSETSGDANVYVGYQSGAFNATGQYSTFLGASTGTDGIMTNPLGAIALGAGARITASNQFVIGGPASYQWITESYQGNGVIAAVPTGTSINATGGSGTDIAGAALRLAGGKNTGAGGPGDVIIQTGIVGASGTTLSSLANRLVINHEKIIAFPSTGAEGVFKVSDTGEVHIGDGTTSTAVHRINTPTVMTVGAAGVAAALPANPALYITFQVNGTDFKVPLYNP